MITTITEVCNLALARLGARRISSYEDDASIEGRACRLQYATVMSGLLRRHQWDFATTSARLSRAATAPLSEYAAAWQLPADCERIIRLSSGDPVNPILNFARRGRMILTGEHEVLELVYVSNAVAVGEWDSLFVEAISLKLAARIAGDVTKNPALAGECNTEFEGLALPHAQTADACETSSGENFGVAALVSQSQLVRMRRRGRWIVPQIPTI